MRLDFLQIYIKISLHIMITNDHALELSFTRFGNLKKISKTQFSVSKIVSLIYFKNLFSGKTKLLSSRMIVFWIYNQIVLHPKNSY
jgi:hypothetical protein